MFESIRHLDAGTRRLACFSSKLKVAPRWLRLWPRNCRFDVSIAYRFFLSACGHFQKLLLLTD